MATEVVIPMLGITVEKGQIVEWLKDEGDAVEKGESIFVVEADKVTTEVESPASGVLAKILLPAGEPVPVLSVVAIITEPGETLAPQYTTSPKPKTEEAVVETSPQDAPAGLKPPAIGSESETIRIVPAARKLALEKGVDLANVSPTGPEGVITFRDIESASDSRPPQAGEAGTKASTLARRKAEAAGVSLEGIEGTGIRGRIMRGDVDQALRREGPEMQATPSAADVDTNFGRIILMDGMRKTIARRLSSSAFTAPHVAFYADIHMDPLLSYRESILDAFQDRYGLRPSINDFLIKAVALTIREFPLLNGAIQEDEIHILPNINVGLAVALADGLVVPAITDADNNGLLEIVRQRSDLVERALKGRLTMVEMERGTFTISSLAQYEITFFTSILNPPQSGILSVGKTRDELALVDGEVKVRHIASMGLAVDHRIIDGVVAAEFMRDLKKKLETPAFTFLHT